MSLNDSCQAAIWKVLELLVLEEYELVIASTSVSRLSADELKTVVKDYGRTLVLPSHDSLMDLDVVPIRGSLTTQWSVRVPLLTREEGKSDLTLELTVIDGAQPTVELDDLHVL